MRFFFPSLAQNICFYFHSFCQQRKYIGITRSKKNTSKKSFLLFYLLIHCVLLCFMTLCFIHIHTQKRNLFNMLFAFYLMLVSANFTLCITQFVCRFLMVIFLGLAIEFLSSSCDVMSFSDIRTDFE